MMWVRTVFSSSANLAMFLALAQVKGQAHTAIGPLKSWRERQEGEIHPGEAGRAEW